MLILYFESTYTSVVSNFKAATVVSSAYPSFFPSKDFISDFLGCFVLRSYSTSPFLGKTWNILIILNRTRHNKNAIAIL